MNDKRTFDALMRFLDYLSSKGLMKPGTVSSRKATANKVLSVLDSSELEDVTVLDMDDAMSRFANLEGQNYAPGSLATYKARLNSTLDDFRAYLDDPLGFRPTVQTRSRRKSEPSSVKSTSKGGINDDIGSKTPPIQRPYAPPPDTTILPIPLRADLVVHIQGLPFDLTEAEANKVAAVIKAMAISSG